MPSYSVFLRDDSNGDLFEILPISYNFTEYLNKEPTASVKISFEELERLMTAYGETIVNALTTTIIELYIERDGEKIFYGILSNMNIRPRAEGERNIILKAVGFFGLFSKRIVGIPKKVYTTTDAGEIAWDLIDTSQTSDNPYSDFGITEGSIDASVNRDRTYRFDNIKDSIILLSNENLDTGFDFEIDNNKAFNVFYPTKGSAKPNIIFDEKILADYRYEKPLILELANIVYAVGEGYNDDVAFETRTAAAGVRSPFGTLEEVLRESNIKTSATLQAKGDRRLDEAGVPIVKFEGSHYDGVDFEWDTYSIGDSIVINIEDIGLSSESKRVIKKKFEMEERKSIGLISFLVE